VVNDDRTKCLGKGKGRHYPPMDASSAKYLQVRHDRIGPFAEMGVDETVPPYMARNANGLVFFSQSFYMTHNIALEKLLKRLGYPIPLWLEEDLSDRPVSNQAIGIANGPPSNGVDAAAAASTGVERLA